MLNGGVIECRLGRLTISGCNSFQNNTASGSGGAIYISNGDLVITNTTCTSFTGNKAEFGGAITIFYCTASIKGDVYFEENSAATGGAIGALYSSLITDDKVWFINNVAEVHGGAIRIAISDLDASGNFFNNRAKYGGAVFFEKKQGNVTFRNINVISNSGSGLWISGSNF